MASPRPLARIIHVAFGGRADMPFALHMSASDPKRTSVFALHVSAFGSAFAVAAWGEADIAFWT